MCKSMGQHTFHHQLFVLKNFGDLVSILCNKYLSTILLSYKMKEKNLPFYCNNHSDLQKNDTAKDKVEFFNQILHIF